VVIDDDTMRRALEAILMVTDEPLPVLTLARAVERPTGDVSAALGALAEEYTEQGRGFDLREVGGGWRYYTRIEAAPYVERFVLDGQQARLTQAALETLAVVAYKQPVSRARVSAIRGVNVDGVMRTLVARGLVEEAGADTESQATLYRTTSYFLERMGMQSLDDLPELAPYLPDMDDIEDELAAQTLPPATPTEDEPGTPSAEDHPSTPPTDEADADEPSTPPGHEAEMDEPSTPSTDADEAPADDADQPDEAAAGIDGDLNAGEPVDLDLEQVSDQDQAADELEPAEDADGAPADDADQPDDADAGIDGDLDVEQEPGGEPADAPTDREEPAGESGELVGVEGEPGSREEVRDGG
jgi:segregation and condensation protein B